MDKALFLQLPPPRFCFSEAPTNIPLAAGFVSAALDATAEGSVSSEILEPRIVDVLADQGLVLEVVKRRPAIVAMTLYVWNVDRSLFLASNIKKLAPQTRILVGGPEVTPDNAWVMRHPSVDAGVFGEGESRIGPLVSALLRGDIPNLPGFFIKTPTGLHLDARPSPVWDLSLCRYPYLDRRISPSWDGTLFLETVRGCPFHCRYCYYHKAFKGVRRHPAGSIDEVLDFAYSEDSGVNEIYLMDPTFNVRPAFKTLAQSMAERRNLREIALHTELRADLLAAEDVILLKAAGLVSAEVGLQTVNPAALKPPGRTGSPEKVGRGGTLLKNAGIEVTTGIILGLPGDTPEGFSATLEWLKRTEAYSVVHPFVLSVLPGTDFRAQAENLGLKFHSRPPYYVISTRTFPEADFKAALLECENTFDMELDYIPPPSLVDQGFSVVTDIEQVSYVSKWIVNLGSSRWRDLLSAVLRKASDPFTFWFKGTLDERSVFSLMQEFVDANPHACVNVALEFEDPPDLRFFEKALQAAANPNHYLNRAYRPLYGLGEIVSVNFWVVRPDPYDAELRDRISEDCASVANVIWEIREPHETALLESSTPLLVSTSMAEIAGSHEKVFDTLSETHSDRLEEVLFRDALLQRKWDSHIRKVAWASRLREVILTT
jgi:radical SAM superfamily enzyme YgiQ (UPF0313 family)